MVFNIFLLKNLTSDTEMQNFILKDLLKIVIDKGLSLKSSLVDEQ